MFAIGFDFRLQNYTIFARYFISFFDKTRAENPPSSLYRRHVPEPVLSRCDARKFFKMLIEVALVKIAECRPDIRDGILAHPKHLLCLFYLAFLDIGRNAFPRLLFKACVKIAGVQLQLVSDIVHGYPLVYMGRNIIRYSRGGFRKALHNCIVHSAHQHPFGII